MVTIGFSLAAYGILKISNMSLLSYGLLFAVSCVNFWYPALACLSLGMIPPSMQNFREQWLLRVTSRQDRKIIKSLRVGGISASGIWIMSLPMFMKNADESMNWIIFVLLSY